MLLANARGLTGLLKRKPQTLVSLALRAGWGRLDYRLRAKRLNGRSHPPEQVTVVVTDLCNLHCKMCQYAHSESLGFRLNQVGRMNPAVFGKLMDELPGRPLVTFTGGEPLLHPDLPDFVADAKSRGRPTSVTTNGWMLAKRAQALSDAGVDLLVVSVDGPPAVHDRIRGSHSFERLSEGLDAILSLPERPIVIVSMSISNLNYMHILPMFDLARGLGVDGINFNHLWMQTEEMVEAFNSRFAVIFQADEVAWEVSPELIDSRRLAASLETIRRRNWGSPFIVTEAPYLQRDEIRTWYRRPEQSVKWTHTRCAWIRMKVWPDGHVKPCRAWSAGSVANQHAMDIWDGGRFREFRRLLATEGTIPICARCCYVAHR